MDQAARKPSSAPLTYGSVCSGIEAASVAWEPLGWRPAFFSEIAWFPSAVLAAHFGSNMPGEPFPSTGVPNHGDFTKIGADAGPIDLLVGGTPCQSFSVAGKRLGLDDPRGNLALEYLALARRLRARWFVWENVPGVLSSYSGSEQANRAIAEGHVGGEADCPENRDFAEFLSFVRECGFGFAYRILDAQYVRVSGFERAVPQRRRRLFVVGYLGDWRPAAAILLEPDGVPGRPPPRRTAGQGVAGTVVASAGRGSGDVDDARDGRLIADEVASTLNAAFGSKLGLEDQHINSGAPLFVAHALRGEGFDASEDGTGRGTPIVPVMVDLAQITSEANRSTPSDVSSTLTQDGDPVVCFDSKGTQVQTETGGVAPTLRSMAHANSHSNAGGQLAIAQPFSIMPMNSGRDFVGRPTDVSQPIMAGGPAGGNQGGDYLVDGLAVRRLTPRECERLQGFHDDWTRIRVRHYARKRVTKLRPVDRWERAEDGGWWLMAADGPRYMACGNSMAVNVMRWIGERIALYERLRAEGRVP